MIYIVENAVDSGGNRVIYQYIKNEGSEYTGYLLRRFTKPKDFLGFLKDVVTVHLKYLGISKPMLLWKSVAAKNYDLVVTTGRRCLDFIDDVSAHNHLHLIQHIEAWKTLNSSEYLNYCIEIGYPSGQRTIEFIINHNDSDEIQYISKLKRIQKFKTVSPFLKEIIYEINPTAIIETVEPPEISYPILKFGQTKMINDRKYDLLIILRGLDFKGDDVGLALINSVELSHLRKVVVLSTKASIKKYKESIDGLGTVFCSPTDYEFALLLSESKIVINSSTSEGFGAVPREALKYGCKCVSSKTGWVINSQKNENLSVVNSHKKNLYIDAVLELYDDTCK